MPHIIASDVLDSAIPKHSSTEQQRKSDLQRLTKRLKRNVGNAVVDYKMIEEGDVIMACISGGKL